MQLVTIQMGANPTNNNAKGAALTGIPMHLLPFRNRLSLDIVQQCLLLYLGRRLK